MYWQIRELVKRTRGLGYNVQYGNVVYLNKEDANKILEQIIQKREFIRVNEDEIEKGNDDCKLVYHIEEFVY